MTIQVLELLNARSHVVAALTRNGSPLAAEIDHFIKPIFRARLGGSLDLQSIGAISHASHDFHPDVVLVTTPDEWVWASLVARRALGAPLVLVRQMSLRLFAGVRWLADRRAHAVIAGSEAVRASLIGRVGIRASLIHVIPNPVRFHAHDDVLSGAARAERREDLGLSRNGHWIGFFGGNDPQKGIGDLMEAVRAVRKAGLDLNVLVCGRINSRYSKSVADWISDNDLNRVDQHRPDVPDVEQAMTAMEAIVVATRSSLGEGLPLTALESMACGTPVIGYSTPGVVEAIGANEEGGLLARADDPADLARAILAILSSPDLAYQIACRALNRARQRFDPMRATLHYERVLESAAETYWRR